jgi:hypothetical protein
MVTRMPGRCMRVAVGGALFRVGAIHLTGGVLVGGSPRTVCWWALQARWAPACRWRRGRHCPWPFAGDEVLVAHGLVGDGEFEHPVEHQPAAAGAAAVEAEHELVEVADQVGDLDRALVGAQQPPFDQRGDPVHRGQQLAGIVPAGAGGALAAPVVEVAQLLQPAVALPGVGDDPRARLDVYRSRKRATRRPRRQTAARSGTGRAPSAREPRRQCRSGPSCRGPAHRAARLPRRRCRSHPPPPSRPVSLSRGAPAPSAVGAASSTRSDTNRSPASAAGSARRCRPCRRRTASKR